MSKQATPISSPAKHHSNSTSTSPVITKSPKKILIEKSFPTVDFSFKNVTNVEAILQMEPRTGYRKEYKRSENIEITETSPVKRIDTFDDDDHHFPKKQVEEIVTTVGKFSKYYGTSLKLNNNSIEKISPFATVLSNLVEHPNHITWIDFSFNNIQDLQHLIEQLLFLKDELQVLYLHGNAMEDISQVKELKHFSKLKSLTLHGNPIDSVKNYKYHVLSVVPHLKSLDFVGVTGTDRTHAEFFKKVFLKEKELSSPNRHPH